MPDPTPIPSASALARAVEASERNRNEIWNEAIEAARLTVDRLMVDGEIEIAAQQKLRNALRALRRETTDAG